VDKDTLRIVKDHLATAKILLLWAADNVVNPKNETTLLYAINAIREAEETLTLLRRNHDS
jgi:hypothetical protein